MNEKAFFFLFAILLIGGFMSSINNNLSGDVATSTAAHKQAATQSSNSVSSGGSSYRPVGNTISQNRYPTHNDQAKPLTAEEARELKKDIEELYDETWELAQKVNAYQRTLPVSRYADLVQLRATKVSRDYDREYLTLTNTSKGRINISDWYLESYVTDTKVALPQGTIIYKAGGSINTTKDIILQPNQRAFLLTTESPLGVSFRENSCIGYVTEDRYFYPSVTANCKYPYEILERYGDIELDDDSCHDFVRRINSCETIEDDDPRLDDLSGKCKRFIENNFNYSSCVANFENQTWFDDVNDWYVYFERDEKLWRKQREIIRLIDEFDEIVAVIEY